ncbi:MAG: hypothetical protein JWM59_3514 [Verrucomicrobiales bacterium]|nr:hypothetical protein [Verrucomicrobiales bacterium]
MKTSASIRSAAIASLLLGLLSALPARAGEQERSLFDGGSLTGWKAPAGSTWQAVKAVTLNPANARAFTPNPGTGVLLNTPEKPTTDLLTEGEFGDCTLHVEFCVPQGSNSGIYMQGRYEVQIFDSFGKKDIAFSDCGGLYERPEKGVGFQGKAPALNASKAPGEWQTFDIEFRAPRFDSAGKKTENAKFLKVTLNGKVIHENVEVDGPTRSAHFNDEKPLGPLMLQGDHGPVAFRNLKIKTAG